MNDFMGFGLVWWAFLLPWVFDWRDFLPHGLFSFEDNGVLMKLRRIVNLYTVARFVHAERCAVYSGDLRVCYLL